jgi:peroxiredoxin
VDIVAFIAYNDGWVMSAWGKVNNVTGNDIVSSSSRLPTMEEYQFC